MKNVKRLLIAVSSCLLISVSAHAQDDIQLLESAKDSLVAKWSVIKFDVNQLNAELLQVNRQIAEIDAQLATARLSRRHGMDLGETQIVPVLARSNTELKNEPRGWVKGGVKTQKGDTLWLYADSADVELAARRDFWLAFERDGNHGYVRHSTLDMSKYQAANLDRKRRCAQVIYYTDKLARSPNHGKTYSFLRTVPNRGGHGSFWGNRILC